MVTVIGYVAVLALLLELLQLPLAFYRGVTLERRYGLSTQTTARWWIDHVKAGVISLVFATGAALLVLALIRWDPERWWILAASAFTVILVLLAQLAPVVLLPLFYTITPLTRDALRERLVALADRAGTRIAGVFEWRLSDRTKKANAALAGIGRTRRILLSDTLLAEHSDDEIEVILAHELAHHVYRDIWSAIVVETVLIALGCYMADLALGTFAATLRAGRQGRHRGAASTGARGGGGLAGADADVECALTRARAPRRSLRADDDAERAGVHQRHAAAGRAESGGGGAIPPRPGALPHAPTDRGTDRGGSGLRAGIRHRKSGIGAGQGLRRFRNCSDRLPGALFTMQAVVRTKTSHTGTVSACALTQEVLDGSLCL